MSSSRKRPPLPPSQPSKLSLARDPPKSDVPQEAEITGEESYGGVIEKKQRQEQDEAEDSPGKIDVNKIPEEEEGEKDEDDHVAKELSPIPEEEEEGGGEEDELSPSTRGAIDLTKLPEEEEKEAEEESPCEARNDLIQKQEQEEAEEEEESPHEARNSTEKEEQEEEGAGEENPIDTVDPNPKQEEGDGGEESPIEAIDPSQRKQEEEGRGESAFEMNQIQEGEGEGEGEAVKEGNSNEGMQNTQNQESNPETVFDFLSNMITQDEADAMDLFTTPLNIEDLSLCTYSTQQHTDNY